MTQAICPQPGAQEAALRSSAAIVVQGGARGGTKSYSLLLKAARWIGVRGYGAVLFRQSEDEVLATGGLWEKSHEIYPHLGGRPLRSELAWEFPAGSRIALAGFGGDWGLSKWLGQQICFIGIDEAAAWRETWFWLLLSSNRSTCGVRPRMHLTCNPDPDSWLRPFLDHWIAPDGYADLQRSGSCRWFVRVKGEIRWADTRRELLAAYPGCLPLSTEFHLAALAHNRILLQTDPTYLSKLELLPQVERERFLGDAVRGGNWNIRHSAGTVFQSGWFPLVRHAPGNVLRVRSWDLAWTATGCWVVGTLIAHSLEEGWFIEDQIAFRSNPAGVHRALREVAALDGREVAVRLPNDGASSHEIDKLCIELAPHCRRVHVQNEIGDIAARSIDLRTQAERGLIKLCSTHPSKGIAQQLAADGIECSTVTDWQSGFRGALDRFPQKPDDHIASFVGGFTALPEIHPPLSEGALRALVQLNPELVLPPLLGGCFPAAPLGQGRYRLQ